jgi:hypothetical protein
MYRVIISSILLLIVLPACSDNAQITKYTDTQTQLTCLRLVVFPPDTLITDTLTKLYGFNENCDYELQVSKKGGIVCNSNQNADKKALSNFPSGYIRMDVSQNNRPVYSYYKDLSCKVTKVDIITAFSRLKEDLIKE